MLATPQHSAMTHLEADLAAPRRARMFVRERLERWRHPELVRDAELLVSELVTNAVMHSGEPHLTLRVDADREAVWVTVGDHSDGLPRRMDAAPTDVTGRGLALVERLASDWGVDVTPWGKEVWFVLAARPVRDRTG
jgi:anti-sigma regulatory factor (Ser/Thr protein kinase)